MYKAKLFIEDLGCMNETDDYNGFKDAVEAQSDNKNDSGLNE